MERGGFLVSSETPAPALPTSHCLNQCSILYFFPFLSYSRLLLLETKIILLYKLKLYFS